MLQGSQVTSNISIAACVEATRDKFPSVGPAAPAAAFGIWSLLFWTPESSTLQLLSSCSPATILQGSMQLQWITALRLYLFSWRPVLFALVTCLSYKSGERLQGKATVTATATGPKAHQQLQEGRGATVWGNCYAPELILACC